MLISDQLRDLIHNWSHARLEDGSFHNFPTAEVGVHDLTQECSCSPKVEPLAKERTLVFHRRVMGGENGDK